MDVMNSTMSAVNSPDMLKETVGIKLLNSAQNMQTSQATVLLQDFSNNQMQMKQAPHPVLGKTLDIYA
jgi:hypothetical protein